MSQQDNFGSGFVLGTLLGGVLGGVVGAVVAARVLQDRADEPSYRLEEGDGSADESLPPSEAEMEIARRGLEDKIAQLNSAIDDVRQRLGGTNGHAAKEE